MSVAFFALLLFTIKKRNLMKKIELKRSYLKIATFGEMSHNGVLICYTVEKPWVSNKPFTSCIPPGAYKIHRYSSKRYPSCFSLENHNLGVYLEKCERSIRDHILIHIANFPSDVEGCIGPGLTLHTERWGVGQSRLAMGELNKLITDASQWELVIT